MTQDEENPAGLSDGELMARLGRGDPAPLGELYLRHAAMVKTALKRFAPEMPGAQLDELTQDAFLALWESATRYREQQRLKAWLYGIAIRLARQWRRRHWLRRRLLERHQGQAAGTGLVHDSSPPRQVQQRQELEQALAALPDAQRDVLLLHAEGFTGEEIATLLGVRPKTVWTRLHRARRTMTKVAARHLGGITEREAAHGRV